MHIDIQAYIYLNNLTFLGEKSLGGMRGGYSYYLFKDSSGKEIKLDNVPDYSSDMNEAIKLVEYIHQKGYHIDITCPDLITNQFIQWHINPLILKKEIQDYVI